jgi:hypothetical protein
MGELSRTGSQVRSYRYCTVPPLSTVEPISATQGTPDWPTGKGPTLLAVRPHLHGLLVEGMITHFHYSVPDPVLINLLRLGADVVRVLLVASGGDFID